MPRSILTGPPSDGARRRLAWGVPIVVAGVIAATAALSSTSASGASPELPSRSAAQLIAAVLSSNATTLTGDFEETANLGIPTLPGGHDSASLSWQTFLSGTHTARVWIGGADKQRVALLGELSEADVVRNGTDLWTYTSDTNTVTHSTVGSAKDAKDGTARAGAETPSAEDATPGAVAAKVLKAIDPTTSVTVDSTQVVADQPAYTLVVRPRDPNSTVDKVTIAIDATKYVPLQVKVFGTGSTVALTTGFTKISYAKPADSTFDFTKPAGATVSNDPFGVHSRVGHRHDAAPSGTTTQPAAPNQLDSAKPKVLGTDWTSVLEMPKSSTGPASALGGSQLRDLTTPVGSSGVRLLHTALLNAVILPDGRTFVGAVQPAYLEHLAATTPN
jgi:outer membrane lipoprotein-sorting protein